MTHPSDATREQLKELEEENRKWPLTLKQVPRSEWPFSVVAMLHPDQVPVQVWRSRHFLVQVFEIGTYGCSFRLSVCRTTVDRTRGRWHEGITWEDLQAMKAQVGLAHYDAVEIYPAQKDIVNVANMRHLWVLLEPVPFAWRKEAHE